MGSGYYRILLVVIPLIHFSTQAGIVVSGTRVIYPADKKEVTVSMKNTGQTPALVQSWIDTGNPTEAPQNIQVPFVLMPPITRIDGGKGQTLRLIYTGGTLPEDRESIFWLNILAVPPKKMPSDMLILNIAYQSRIKIFFRPNGLSGKKDEAGNRIVWKKTNTGLSVSNPTPYYISLVDVSWSLGKGKHSLHGEMIAPFSTLNFQYKEYTLPGITKISFGVINDQGLVSQFTTTL